MEYSTQKSPDEFCSQLPVQLTGDIEVKIHGNFSAENEDTPVQLLEIYVQ